MSRRRARIMVSEALPELSVELQRLLYAAGETSLAESVRELRVVDRCRCGDDFCATFYTAPPPNGSYGQTLRSLELEPEQGMIILDVVEERIVCVEVLYRPAVSARLLQLLP